MRKKLILLLLISFNLSVLFGEILIPMDESQNNHLKAYGIAFNALKDQISVKWLLNYRGGSFLIPEYSTIINNANIAGVSFSKISSSAVAEIFTEIEQKNMEIVLLEKEPKIAIYTPPNSQPWDDAVTMALTYAEIDYEQIWDKEVITEGLADYDWLHLHHEDFTGQYGKFYASYRNTKWYKENQKINEKMASDLNFQEVWELKHAVAAKIQNFVSNGGFLFAMCGATDTIDIALAALKADIVGTPYDGDGIDENYSLNYKNTFAFKDFSISKDPYEYEFSDIDISDYMRLKGAEEDYFMLFDFSAKYDPVPTMLVQNHKNIVDGFLGQTTGFYKKVLKKSVIILGQNPGGKEVKYIHGNFGKGTFTFYGGHDPEDYQHKIGDPPTVLDLHKNSPGYRLILNNVLFPAAKKKKIKT